MDTEKLQKRFDELSKILVDELNPQGFWNGRLSFSALGVAVAIAALHFHDREKHSERILRGLKWLYQNINSDGSFGDTPESPGNVSTSLLVYAVTNLYAPSDPEMSLLQDKIANYLIDQNVDVHSPQVAKAILDHYQKDYTFSVPILTMCGLCGVPGKEAFQYIPQLPFELSLVPRRFYRMLNLSVVSYAIPALIAVGIVVFKKKQTTAFGRTMRMWAIKPSLNLLRRLMPDSGGFLEAIPLTAFVCLSLIESGFTDLEVVTKGIHFLEKTQREDGGWAIDVDLSTWVTTLSVKALRSKKDEALSLEIQSRLASHLMDIQNLEVHPFNGSCPGGWGWTNYSGSVPDGDDTPGTILALLRLQPRSVIKDQVLAGCDWLLSLQNKDGGFPTFSKGWGKLPFDQSCADLTGHCLLAISSVLENYHEEIEEALLKAFRSSFNHSLAYLIKHQRSNGSWLPLWFGNQFTPDHSNPVYGTAKVSTYLKDSLKHQWMNDSTRFNLKELIQSGENYLLSVQNKDGSWGGDRDIAGSIEETALAISALDSIKHSQEIAVGLNWLDQYYRTSGLKASPIGLYFASLWYDEKMYPLTSYLEALARVLETKD